MTHGSPTGKQFNKDRVLHEGAGVDFAPPSGAPPAIGERRERWITEEEIARNELFEENWKIYRGEHSSDDGGPFKHPYDREKQIQEGIPYIVVNMMGHATDTWSTLILGEDFRINSKDDVISALLNPVDVEDEEDDEADASSEESSMSNQLKQTINDAVIKMSALGRVGLQPHVEEEDGEKKLKLSLIEPANLRVNWFPARDEIESIEKFTRYDDPEAGDTTTDSQHASLDPGHGQHHAHGHPHDGGGRREILVVEKHFKGKVETKLFRIQGVWILEELPLPWFSLNIDESVTLVEIIDTKLKDFQITILDNKRIGRNFESDYSKPAKDLQQALNNRYTQENRILDMHSNPKLILPRNIAKKDPETGRYYVDIQGRDVYFFDPESGEVLPQYMTWDGQLDAASKQKLNLIQAILTEMKIAPSLTAFSDIIGATVADTFSKMRLVLHTTLNKTDEKRGNVLVALTAVIRNGLTMAAVSRPNDFAVNFPDPIPKDRLQDVDEMIARKESGLISSRTAIMRLDGLTEDEAEEEYGKILEERDREGTGALFPPGFGSGTSLPRFPRSRREPDKLELGEPEPEPRERQSGHETKDGESSK